MKTARIFFVSILATCYLLLATSFAFAQTPPTNTNPDVPNNLHTWTQNVFIETLSSITCMLSGVDPVNPSQGCLGIDEKTHKIGFVKDDGHGAIGAMGNLIGMTFDLPIHTADYVRYLAGSFGITKPAYAQGIGFQGLNPLISVWSAFRNIVYLLFVLVFVAIGFAIMLRVRIDPRTVMTIENQIPRIIIALVLVTFSFAIAGVMIDLMWTFIGLSVHVFTTIDPKTIPDTGRGIDLSIATSTHPIDAIGAVGGPVPISFSAGNSVGNVIGPLFDNDPGRLLISAVLAAIGRFGLSDLIVDLIGGIGVAVTGGVGTPAVAALIVAAKTGVAQTIVNGVLAVTGGLFAPTIAGVLGGLIAFIVILIAVMWALFRLWFTLLLAYIFILMDVVFAPFWIIAGLMPGQGLSFSTWFRHILAYLSAFPATIIMFMLGKVFIDMFGNTPSSSAFVPPLVGNPGTPGLLGSLIGLGVILTTPTVVNTMINTLKAPKFDLAPLATAIGVGTGALTGLPGGVAGYGSTLFGLSHIGKFKGITKRLGYDSGGQGRP